MLLTCVCRFARSLALALLVSVGCTWSPLAHFVSVPTAAVPSIFGVDSVRGEKRLQLVITFRKLDEIRGEIDRTGQTRRTRRILGVDVPNVVIPVSEGRDLVNLVETAAQQQKLLMSGCDPVSGLSERLRRRAEKPARARNGKGIR